MVSAAPSARVFHDDELGVAVKSLERILTACYKPGFGVAHGYDGQPRIEVSWPISVRWLTRASSL
jgi:hypothetical protein